MSATKVSNLRKVGNLFPYNFCSNKYFFCLGLFLIGVFANVQAQPRQDSIAHDEFPVEMNDSIAYQYLGEVLERDNEEESSSSILIAPDTLKVEPRHFDESTLEELRQDKDFEYEEAPSVGESLWQTFWRWLMQWIGEILEGAVTTDWARVLLYVICLFVVIFVVMALLKVDAFKALFKGADVSSRAGVFHEDIHAMDFDALIKDAMGKKDFRNAVRLIFLHSLKLLSDGQYIRWQPGKTNHDYLFELKAGELKTDLGELSFYFEYAWYGGFPVSEVQFNTVSNTFNNLKGRVA